VSDHDGDVTPPDAFPSRVFAEWNARFWGNQAGEGEEIGVTPSVLNAARSGHLTLYSLEGERLMPPPERAASALQPEPRDEVEPTVAKAQPKRPPRNRRP